MSTKKLHILKFWRKALIAITKDTPTASAGEVGKSVGQSRNTAKKYLTMLVQEGVVGWQEHEYKNGMPMIRYYPIKDTAK